MSQNDVRKVTFSSKFSQKVSKALEVPYLESPLYQNSVKPAKAYCTGGINSDLFIQLLHRQE